jgi:hypothetical protein
MAIIITNQTTTIKFDLGDGEEHFLDKEQLSIKKKFGFVYVYGSLQDTEKFTKLRMRYTDISSPVLTSNTHLVTTLLGYKASTPVTIGSVTITDGVETVKVESNGAMAVSIQDQHSDAIDLYVHTDNATPTITVNPSVGDQQITVNSIVGVVNGNAITINEGIKTFQSIITGSSGSVITFATPLDYDFSVSAAVSCGDWNMAVNGSVTPVVFYLRPPAGANWDLYTFNVSITDDVVMDSGKFGGIAALTNGLFSRIVNGVIKNLPVIVNNLGFAEIGFTIRYDDKAPAGIYGFLASKNYSQINGVSIRLEGSGADEFQVIIQDDLTDLTHMAITANGHVVQD